MKKKFLYVLATGMLLFGLAGCGAAAKNSDDATEKKDAVEKVDDAETESIQAPDETTPEADETEANPGKTVISDEKTGLTVELTYNDTAFVCLNTSRNGAHFMTNHVEDAEEVFFPKQYDAWKNASYLMVTVIDGVTAQEYFDEVAEPLMGSGISSVLTKTGYGSKTLYRIDSTFFDSGAIYDSRCLYEKDGYLICLNCSCLDYSHVEEIFGLFYVDAEVVEES